MFLRAPPIELAPFVEVFWEAYGFAHFARERILPRTTLELMFNLGQPHRVLDPEQQTPATAYRDAWLSGLQQRPLVIEPCFDATRVPSHLMAVRLRPAGAYALLGMPMSELSNGVVELADLSEPRYLVTHALLLETASRAARFELLEALMRERVARGVRVRPFIRWATARIDRAHGSVRILALCRELGVSRKHLSQCFRQQVGVTPKQYAAVARFQRLVACLARPGSPGWPELAQSCGFYDQAHLVHDCRIYAGMTPTSLHECLSPDGMATVEG